MRGKLISHSKKKKKKAQHVYVVLWLLNMVHLNWSNEKE